MKRSNESAFQLAFVYVGTVVGAGFATGKEIVEFFVRFGWIGLLGILISGVIFTGLGDFMAAVTSNEEGSVFKAFGKFKTRIIACVILFLLPALINFALEFINDSFYYETAAGQGTEIKVGNVADCGIGNS